jgi:predicted membrane protein
MDKNKIVTIIVAIVWVLAVLLKAIGVISLGQFRIISLIIAALYALFFYRDRIFKKK